MSLTVGGIVLCGGESRRMGRPKAWLPFGSELMLQRVVRILSEVVYLARPTGIHSSFNRKPQASALDRPQTDSDAHACGLRLNESDVPTRSVSPIVVVAAPGQDLPPLPSAIEIVRDSRQGRGPLEGLAAGLARIASLGVDAAYATSTDVPFLNPNFIRRMIDLLGDSAIAVSRVEDRHHPLAAVYRVTVLPDIEHLLAQDRLRPIFLFDAVPTRVVEAAELRDADPEFTSLRNLNSPEEYETAVRDARSDVRGCEGTP